MESDNKTKVLLVDDSASMREMVSYTLKTAGFDITTACDGVEALSAAAQDAFDLVITDINMPNMDGFTLIEELRKLPAYKFKPILTLTTEASNDKKLRGKEAGATGWIVKPFDPDHLLNIIKRVL